MQTYRRLETPKLYAVFKTQVLSDAGVLSDGVLVAPSTIQVIIEDSTGTVVQTLTNASLYESTDGKYYYMDYTIPLDANLGVWNYEIRGTTSSRVASGRGSFEVLDQVA